MPHNLENDSKNWNSMFDALIEFKNTYGHCLGPEKASDNILLSNWIEYQRKNFPKLDSIQRSLLLELGFVVNYRDALWEKSFQKLIRFKKIYGHTNVPPKYDHDPSLGRWVVHLRERRESLSEYRKKKLDDIHFHWNPFDKIWNEHFQELKKFKEEFGHCNVPEGYKYNKKLARWVATMRHRRDIIDIEKRTLLDQIGFIWKFRDYEWEINFLKLVEFKGLFGHCNVPISYKGDTSLGAWAIYQRKYFYKNSSERNAKLDSIGFFADNNLKRSKRGAKSKVQASGLVKR